jgi:RND family efflux transporter MFP subunit
MQETNARGLVATTMTKHSIRLWAGALLASVLPLSACSSHTNAATTEENMPVVPAAHAVRTDLSNGVTLTAEFEPFYEVDVMAKEAGYVRHMYVDIGDHVREGQLLATLEIPELQDELTKAKADVQTALAEKAAADGDLERSEAAQAIAHLSYTRILDVSKKEPGLVPLQEVDVARSRDLEAQAQISAAQQNVQAAISRCQAANAELAHENSLYAYTRIVSPFRGVITQRFASDGSMIQAGISSETQAMPVVKVSENDVLRLMLPVPEQNVGVIHDGETVKVSVSSLNKSFQGSVTRFADRLQTSTRTMIAEVDVKNPKLELIPGMYAQVQLNLADANNAIAVPIEAIDGAGENQRVFVVDGDGVIHIHTLTTGLQSPQYVQVLSGVRAGEAVIIGRHSDYHDGERVQTHFEDSPAPASHS